MLVEIVVFGGYARFASLVVDASITRYPFYSVLIREVINLLCLKPSRTCSLWLSNVLVLNGFVRFVYLMINVLVKRHNFLILIRGIMFHLNLL